MQRHGRKRGPEAKRRSPLGYKEAIKGSLYQHQLSAGHDCNGEKQRRQISKSELSKPVKMHNTSQIYFASTVRLGKSIIPREARHNNFTRNTNVQERGMDICCLFVSRLQQLPSRSTTLLMWQKGQVWGPISL